MAAYFCKGSRKILLQGSMTKCQSNPIIFTGPVHTPGKESLQSLYNKGLHLRGHFRILSTADLQQFLRVLFLICTQIWLLLSIPSAIILARATTLSFLYSNSLLASFPPFCLPIPISKTSQSDLLKTYVKGCY